MGEDRFLLLASVLGELGLRNGCEDCTIQTVQCTNSSFRVCTFVVRAYVGKFAKGERERETGREGAILSCLRGFGLYGWLLGVGRESGVFWGF